MDSSASEASTKVTPPLCSDEVAPSQENRLADSDVLLPVGTKIGRYVVQGELGAGGMGRVYRAEDPALDRPVALKLVRSASADEHRDQARLLREAKALARLSHPNIVEIFDAGVHEDCVYIAMELVEGETLRKWSTQRPRSVKEILSVLHEAGKGLAAAHEVGIVHRDFKPSNVMIGPEDRVRVVDFGISRDTRESSDRLEASRRASEDASHSHRDLDIEMTRLTRTGLMLGTPAYMAPEQFRNGAIDARTDQFAFCVVAYKLLFRTAPYPGASQNELAVSVVKGVPRPPPRSKVPASVRRAILKGLSGNPDRRFASMRELLDAIAPHHSAVRGSGAAVAVVAVVGMLGFAAWADEDDSCESLATEPPDFWTAQRRLELETALASSDSQLWPTVRSSVDAYVEQYQNERLALCSLRSDPSRSASAQIDAVNLCLADRRERMVALLNVIAESDAASTTTAPQAILSLRSLPPCSDEVDTADDVYVPSSPEVDALRGDLARFEARLLAGDRTLTTKAVESAAARGRELNAPALQVRAMELRAAWKERQGKLEEALDSSKEGASIAAKHGLRRAEASALIKSVGLLGRLERYEEAEKTARQAEALVHALSDPPELAAKLHLQLGTALLGARELEPAQQELERAIATAEGFESATYIALSARTNRLGMLGMTGRHQAVIDAATETLPLAVEQLGPQSLVVAGLYINRGTAQMHLGNYDDAIADLERGLALDQNASGQLGVAAAQAQHNLGLTLAHLGRADEALAAYRDAYDRKLELLGEDSRSAAATANNLGYQLMKLDRPREALPWLHRALVVLENSPRPPPALVDVVLLMAAAHLELDELELAEKYRARAEELAHGEIGTPFHRKEAAFVTAKIRLRRGDDPVEVCSDAAELRRHPQGGADLEVELNARVDDWMSEHCPDTAKH